jgi:hypothetical protein
MKETFEKDNSNAGLYPTDATPSTVRLSPTPSPEARVIVNGKVIANGNGYQAASDRLYVSTPQGVRACDADGRPTTRIRVSKKQRRILRAQLKQQKP